MRNDSRVWRRCTRGRTTKPTDKRRRTRRWNYGSVLAKVYDRLNKTEKAEDQVRSILRKEPDNIWARLALASLLLKRSQDESALREAEGVLVKTRPFIEKRDTPEAGDLQVHFVLTAAVFDSLTGSYEVARAELKEVLDRDQDNDYAKAILAAMGPP